MNPLTKIPAEARFVIYLVAVAVTLGFVVFGHLTTEQFQTIADSVVKVVDSLAMLLAAANVPKSQ